MGFDFVVAKPAGTEAVRCFAADKALDKVLPKEMAEARFGPIGVKNERELLKIFRSLEKVAISEATLIVTVESLSK